ncbi:MAG: amidohydrolase family protein [Planctomycetaceae bacterium]|nr:amidohydrolase family protein [Planctomycetaceae bacterium]
MPKLIDTNLYLSRWPFRRLPGDETEQLIHTLKQQEVNEAWVGSFDGLFHRDIAGVNERLHEESRTHGDGLLIPFGSINPLLPDWEEDIRRCQEEYQMPGIRLHPNYHEYDLNHPQFARLLDIATERGLIVQLALSMEDERTQHPLMSVPHVDPAPLKELVLERPLLKLQLLNVFRSLPVSKVNMFSGIPNICFEIAMLEGVGGIEQLLGKIPPKRILFGSYYPFFHIESAQLKLMESTLGRAQQVSITYQNAHQLRNPS